MSCIGASTGKLTTFRTLSVKRQTAFSKAGKSTLTHASPEGLIAVTNANQPVATRIHRIEQIAETCKCSVTQLRLVLNMIENDPDRFYRRLLAIDPTGRRKEREVLSVRGEARLFQERLLARRLVNEVPLSPNAHGSVAERSIRTNFRVHKNSSFMLLVDIESFFPSLKTHRVYQFFITLGYHPDVARICTRLCTFDGHLALGLVTSPIIANGIFVAIDRQLQAMCKNCGLVYSRYLDDLAFSGPYDLAASGILSTVETVIRRNGLRLGVEKTQFGRLDDGDLVIAGIRKKNGRACPRSEFLADLEEALIGAEQLASKGIQPSLYLTRGQLMGKAYFLRWINNARSRVFLKRLRRIDWHEHSRQSQVHGLVKQTTYLADPITRQPIG